MNIRSMLVLLFLYTTTVVATKDYYHPNEDPDRLILWKGLFTKINILVADMEKVNQNLVGVKNRQEDQANQIIKLQEAADFNTKYLKESKERQEDQANQIIKLQEAVDFNAKYLKESKQRQEDQDNHIIKLQEAADFNTKYLVEVRFESKQRLEHLEGKISKIMETTELSRKYLTETRLESNKKLEDEGIQIVKLEEDFNATSKLFDKRQEEQGIQIIKLREAVDLTTKFVNESRSECNKRLVDQAELLKKQQWTTILRRKDGSVDFYRNWAAYQKGFGNPPYGEFFIGLDILHEMTTNGPHELMVVLKDWNDEMALAHYDLFEIGGEDDQYALNKLGTYSGDAGDSLKYHKGAKFSTLNRDNDESGIHCANEFKGAWWFKGCSLSHLAGPYRKVNDFKKIGVQWYDWKNTHNYSCKYAEMKIRAKDL